MLETVVSRIIVSNDMHATEIADYAFALLKIIAAPIPY